VENRLRFLDKDLLERTVTVNVILRCPKVYSLGKVLIALITFTGVQLTPIAKLTGIQSDRFDWCQITVTGTISSLVDVSAYFRALRIDVDVIESTFQFAP
jgi:hypothetical protein